MCDIGDHTQAMDRRFAMKRNKSSVLTMCFLLAMSVLFLTGARMVSAENAEGLVERGGRYYFCENGSDLLNSWKTLYVGGSSETFYFGADGAAYCAERMEDGSYNVQVFSIQGKRYGFDNAGHLLERGIYVNHHYQLFVFDKKGIYNQKATKKLRKTLKPYSKTGKVSRDFYRLVLKKLGKPLKTVRSNSCSPLNERDSFTDVVLKYRYFEVQLIQNKRTKEYAIDNFFPCKEVTA